MTQRAQALQAMADSQIGDLIGLLSGATPASLRRPCPGRDKLGDGTAGALAVHMTDNFQRIGGFVAREGSSHGSDHGGHQHGDRYAADRYAADRANTTELSQRLLTARRRLARIALLTDAELDAVPAKDSVRFADGQRTLEQVLTGLFRHQGRQLEAVAAALG